MRQERGGGRRPSDLIFLFSLWRAMGVEENRWVAIFLYTFFGKKAESVEENRGVAIFLYTFLWEMDEV